MDTLEAIKTRRAIKHYDADYQMPQDDVNTIFSLALLSPTAFNIQNWRFVAVSDSELREQIKVVAWNQEQVTTCSLFVVLCANLKSWESRPERYWANAPQPVQEIILPAIDQYYRDKDQVQRDEAMRSCGIAAQTMMLAAKALGYDSCPMDGFDFDAVARLIRLPKDHVIAMCIAIGKGTKEPWSRPGQLSVDEVVIKNRF